MQYQSHVIPPHTLIPLGYAKDASIYLVQNLLCTLCKRGYMA